MSKKQLRLFDEQIARKPNQYPWTDDFIDKMWTSFWTPNEFDFKTDYDQFHFEMTAEEQKIIVRTLSAIGQIEIAVKRFWAQLGDNLPHPSMTDLGFVMANSETVHNRAYEKLIETLKLSHVFEENLKEPVIKRRVDYLRKYLKKVYKDDKQQYIYAIILFTLFVEYVSLFSQFYIGMWFNRYRNILKDMAQQISYTRGEETIHSLVGVKIINTLRVEYPELFTEELKQRIYDETRIAADCESDVVDWILGEYAQNKLSAPVLKNYIRSRLNDALDMIGFEPQFEIDDELLKQTKWMEEETMGNNFVDFFHRRPVDYAKNNKTFNSGDLF